MKNEWDLLAELQRQLIAGVTLLTLEINYSPADEEYLVMDEAGQLCQVGPDFMPALIDLMRSLQVPFSVCKLSLTRAVFQAGRGLPPFGPPPGSVDVLATGLLPSQYFGISLDDNENEDDEDPSEAWKKLR